MSSIFRKRWHFGHSKKNLRLDAVLLRLCKPLDPLPLRHVYNTIQKDQPTRLGIWLNVNKKTKPLPDVSPYYRHHLPLAGHYFSLIHSQPSTISYLQKYHIRCASWGMNRSFWALRSCTKWFVSKFDDKILVSLMQYLGWMICIRAYNVVKLNIAAR